MPLCATKLDSPNIINFFVMAETQNLKDLASITQPSNNRTSM
jgi:hypothetical protein